MRTLSWRSVPLTVIVLAAACSSAPTDASPPNSAPMAFTVGPAAISASAHVDHQLIRTLETISRRNAPQARVVGSAANVNSPLDLSWHGGKVMASGTSYDLYMNCESNATGCWGSGGLSPKDFLQDLAGSRMVHIADQYVDTGRFAALQPFVSGRRYDTQELSGTMSFNQNVAQIDDIFSIVYAAYQQTGKSGYTAIYHVFLPQGTDMCITPTDCYSPDNLNTFQFCAFHGSVDFIGGPHLLFSVEPYQAVSGCQFPQQSVISATSSTLGHEFFEAITDPDLDAWWSSQTGEESADLCQAFVYPEHLGAHTYTIQTIYSNRIHNCSDSP